MTFEVKGNSMGKSLFQARNDIDKYIDQIIENNVLEQELLAKGWVLFKTFSTIQWHYPNTPIRIWELQNLFSQQGVTDTFWLEKELPHPLGRDIAKALTG